MPKVSFITANYVARSLNYNGDPDWSTHDAATTRLIDGEGGAKFLATIRDHLQNVTAQSLKITAPYQFVS